VKILTIVWFDGALAFFVGVPPTNRLGSAKHHPQKRHLPRQAGQAQAICVAVEY
jgi:hypothetical protein